MTGADLSASSATAAKEEEFVFSVNLDKSGRFAVYDQEEQTIRIKSNTTTQEDIAEYEIVIVVLEETD